MIIVIWKQTASPHPQSKVGHSCDTTDMPWDGEGERTRSGTVTLHRIRAAADLEDELCQGVIKSRREQEGPSAICQQSRREGRLLQSSGNPVPHRPLLLRHRYCCAAGMGNLCILLCEFSTLCFSHKKKLKDNSNNTSIWKRRELGFPD